MMQFLMILLAGWLVAGCGQSAGKAKLDLKALETSFAAAGPEIKDVVDKSMADAKSGNYRPAFDELAKLLKNPNVTPEQLQSLQDTMHQLTLLFPAPVPSIAMPKP